MCTILVLLIIKPVYNNMQEEVFLKIGGNRNVWDVYKYYTLCKSFLELDLFNSIVFMITSVFIWFNIEQRDTQDNKQVDMLLLIPEIFIFVILLVNNWHGHFMVLYCSIYLILFRLTKKDTNPSCSM